MGKDLHFGTHASRSFQSMIDVFSFLLGRHRAALDKYAEAQRLSPHDWVSGVMSWSLEEMMSFHTGALVTLRCGSASVTAYTELGDLSFKYKQLA